ncbi:MAG: PaaI family thioesterase [Chloroflexota bacterium]
MTQPAEDMNPSPFVQLIGAKMESWSAGLMRMSLVMEEKHMNPNGVSHGGVLTTLMDEVAGAAVGLVRGLDTMQGAPHATVEMNTSFMSGPRVGDEIVIEGRALKVGRSVAFAEAEVRRSGRDDLVAKGRFTYVIVEPRSV